MKCFVILMLWVLLSLLTIAQPIEEEVRALDAYEIERVLNPSEGVAVVIYSNPDVQDRTREAGLLLHEFVGEADFQFMVLVDLRKTMADWAPGYTKRRIQRDLMEKFKALPPIPNRDLEKMGRPDVSAIADFKGETCNQLGWSKPKNQLRILIFYNGKEVNRWEDLTEMQELPDAVRNLLQLEASDS
ncbi:MAG: hypothetical protein AAF571_06185 [Verrucomicrobiota bacterium]